MSAMVNPAVVRLAGAGAVRPGEDSLAARVLGWLRRLTGFRAVAVDAPLRAEARLSLGPKKSLVLVNCCGRCVLVGLSGDAIVPLGEWPETSARTKRAGGRRNRALRKEVAP
jgi:flagellar biogenesis protein FliO